jgi:hypothetical protein
LLQDNVSPNLLLAINAGPTLSNTSDAGRPKRCSWRCGNHDSPSSSFSTNKPHGDLHPVEFHGASLALGIPVDGLADKTRFRHRKSDRFIYVGRFKMVFGHGFIAEVQ